MSKYVGVKPSGGVTITVFSDQVDSGNRIPLEDSDFSNLNVDKCRIDSNGKLYEDKAIVTNQELYKQLKNGIKLKLKNIGLTDEEIGVLTLE